MYMQLFAAVAVAVAVELEIQIQIEVEVEVEAEAGRAGAVLFISDRYPLQVVYYRAHHESRAKRVHLPITPRK